MAKPHLCSVGFSAQEQRRNERKKVLGVISRVCVNIPALFPLEKQQQNPGHGSCPLPAPLAWCRDSYENPQQIPLSEGNVCPQEKGPLRVPVVATQVQHGFKAAGFELGSHGGFAEGQGKFSSPVAAMELLTWRGVRAFR